MADSRTLSRENCRQALQKFLRIDDFQLNSFNLSNFHHPLQGLVGEHFTLRVNYTYNSEDHTESFFVKTLSNNRCLSDISKSLLVYEKEEFYYRLLDEYEKNNIDTSFAPKGLFFKPYVTVLEDLSSNYKGTPKHQLMDFEHCRVCFETLAKFHASSIIYEKRKEQESGRKYSLNDENVKILEDKLGSKEEDSFGKRFFTSCIQAIFQLIDLIPENHIPHEVFKSALDQLLSAESTTDGLVSGILHADLWTSNFLYLYRDGRPVNAKLLDFQTVKYGPLEEDLAVFLMTNTSRVFREEHSESLIGHYYDKLHESLTKAGLTSEGVLPPKSDFVRSYDDFKIAGKLHAIVDHSHTFLADGIYSEALTSEETFSGFLFKDRGKYVIESYNNNEVFRNVLHEDVLELRDLLFSE